MRSEETRQEELHIVVFNKDEVLQVLPLPVTGVVTIGRGAENTVTVTDIMLSRRHAAITVSAEGSDLRLTVEDLDSTNGTQVGDRAIEPRSPTRFSPGDPVVLGSIALVVKAGAGPAVGAHFSDFDPAFELRAREAAFEARVRVEALRRKLEPRRRSRDSLELLAPPKGKPPTPSSSGAPLALPGPGYLFDDLVRARRGR